MEEGTKGEGGKHGRGEVEYIQFSICDSVYELRGSCFVILLIIPEQLIRKERTKMVRGKIKKEKRRWVREINRKHTLELP